MKDKSSNKCVLSFNESPKAAHHRSASSFRLLAFALFAGLLIVSASACEDAMVDMDTFSSIRGVVLDDTTGAAVAGASVTTTPATEAILTNNSGEFRIDDIPTGDYAIIVRKYGYERRTVNVAVRENRTTQATITLSPPVKQEELRAESSVSITHWRNTLSTDSTVVTVNVEYIIANNGSTPIPSYSILFKIESPRGVFSHQEEGTNLEVGQTRLGKFSVDIPEEEATRVVAEPPWTGGSQDKEE